MWAIGAPRTLAEVGAPLNFGICSRTAAPEAMPTYAARRFASASENSRRAYFFVSHIVIHYIMKLM